MRLWVVVGCIWVIIVAILAGAAGWYVLDYLHGIDEENALPYINESFTNGKPYPYWDKDYVSINATGLMTVEDWWALQNVMNEWNTKIDRPKLMYNQSYADIPIKWDYAENESWAGATYASYGPDCIFDDARIVIRTSWPHSRQHVIQHELGHAMGLMYHSNHRDSIMYKSATGDPDCWSEEDLEVIRSIYNR